MNNISRNDTVTARPIDYRIARPGTSSYPAQPLSMSGFPHSAPAFGSMIAAKPSFL